MVTIVGGQDSVKGGVAKFASCRNSAGYESHFCTLETIA